MRQVVRYHRIPNIVDELLKNDFWGGVSENGCFKPAVNIKENESEYSLNFSVPGYDKNELKVSVNNNVLTISHESENKENTDSKFLKREFESGSFKRSFELPENAESEKIEASHINGILTIKIPKRAKVEIQVQDIEVK